jgi:hypothetical protein
MLEYSADDLEAIPRVKLPASKRRRDSLSSTASVEPAALDITQMRATRPAGMSPQNINYGGGEFFSMRGAGGPSILEHQYNREFGE